jgi:hypothetical protein
LFKFRNDLDDATIMQIDAKFKELSNMAVVSNLAFGPTFTDRHRGYTHLLTVDVPDKSVNSV